MHNFKHGDRVVYVGLDPEYNEPLKRGRQGTVDTVAGDSGPRNVPVTWDEPWRWPGDYYSGVYPKNIALIEPKATEPTIDDLRKVVSALREQGMKITVTVERTVTEEV